MSLHKEKQRAYFVARKMPFALDWCLTELIEVKIPTVRNLGKKTVLILELHQISSECETPHFDAPCDLCKYRKNLDEQNHHHGRVSAKHLQVIPFHIDPACGCNFVKKAGIAS